MERMVTKRLEWYLEKNNLLSDSQCGFRWGYSTADQVTCLEMVIKRALSENKAAIVVFLDLEGAFDKVWHMALLNKLQKIGIVGRMLGWLQSYLANRKFRVYFEGHYSEEKSVSSGVPQGAVISPILFNILMYDIEKQNNIYYSEYADDVAIFSVDQDVHRLVDNMQQAVDSFVQWCNRNRQKISITKTKAMHFNCRKIVLRPLTLGNSPIEYVDNYKFLGVILDGPTLNWKKHIEHIRNKCMGALSIMKSLSNYK